MKGQYHVWAVNPIDAWEDAHVIELAKTPFPPHRSDLLIGLLNAIELASEEFGFFAGWRNQFLYWGVVPSAGDELVVWAARKLHNDGTCLVASTENVVPYSEACVSEWLVKDGEVLSVSYEVDGDEDADDVDEHLGCANWPECAQEGCGERSND